MMTGQNLPSLEVEFANVANLEELRSAQDEAIAGLQLISNCQHRHTASQHASAVEQGLLKCIGVVFSCYNSDKNTSVTQ
jgi:hypothetical protein